MCDKIKESTIADKNYVERKYTANVAETERNAKDVLLSSRLTNPPWVWIQNKKNDKYMNKR